MENILTLIEVIVLIAISGLCSGLNLSLMSLEVSDLQRRAKNGNKRAKLVLPLRQNAHLSLASILLVNVAVVSATSLVLESRFNGLIAGAASTLLIVIFGEIFPQALLLKRALRATARLAPFLKIMIVVTYPLSKPLQLLLDKLFGRDNARLHSRRELGMIISEHLEESAVTELDDDEVEIMRGALSLSNKRVRDITTEFKHVYWATPETVVDAKKIDEIKSENWSRIPIFSSDRSKTYGILLMKDLVDIDFDSRSYTMRELPTKPLRTIGSMTALDTMFRKFVGSHTHLMAVKKDDKFIGIVTIEDLIEEIIGHEIEDESDE